MSEYAVDELVFSNDEIFNDALISLVMKPGTTIAKWAASFDRKALIKALEEGGDGEEVIVSFRLVGDTKAVNELQTNGRFFPFFFEVSNSKEERPLILKDGGYFGPEISQDEIDESVRQAAAKRDARGG